MEEMLVIFGPANQLPSHPFNWDKSSVVGSADVEVARTGSGSDTNAKNSTQNLDAEVGQTGILFRISSTQTQNFPVHTRTVFFLFPSKPLNVRQTIDFFQFAKLLPSDPLVDVR